MTKTKQKTRKSVSKRFKVTKNGKVVRRQSFKGHLNTKKSAKRKRRLGTPKTMKTSFAKRIKKFIGHKKRGKSPAPQSK